MGNYQGPGKEHLPNPEDRITVFDFYVKTLSELPARLEREIGYKVETQNDLWTLSLKDHCDGWHVTATVIYWKMQLEKRNPELYDEFFK